MTKEIIETEIERLFPQFNRGEVVAGTMVAEWMQDKQKQIDIEKAYSIFKELLDEYYAEKDGTEKYIITFEQFKRAVEE